MGDPITFCASTIWGQASPGAVRLMWQASGSRTPPSTHSPPHEAHPPNGRQSRRSPRSDASGEVVLATPALADGVYGGARPRRPCGRAGARRRGPGSRAAAAIGAASAGAAGGSSPDARASSARTGHARHTRRTSRGERAEPRRGTERAWGAQRASPRRLTARAPPTAAGPAPVVGADPERDDARGEGRADDHALGPRGLRSRGIRAP